MDRACGAEGKKFQMIALFVSGLLLHGLNLILPAWVRDSRRLNVAANLLNAAALLCGLVFR